MEGLDIEKTISKLLLDCKRRTENPDSEETSKLVKAITPSDYNKEGKTTERLTVFVPFQMETDESTG